MGGYSEDFNAFWGYSLIGTGVAAIIYVAWALTQSDKDLEDLNPVNLPLIVALGAVMVLDLDVGKGALFGFTFTYGLLTGMLGFSFFRPFRDALLSLASVALIWPQMQTRWGEGPQVVWVVLALGLLAGMAFLIATVNLGRIAVAGVGLLAAVGIIDFLISPFGLSHSEYTSDQATIISIVAASLLGVGIASHPRLVIGLGVLSIYLGQLLFTLFLAISQENGESIPVAVDWSGWITLAGCLLGFVMTVPFWAKYR